ncbi:winged helix-turn-helix domain-containing protein [Enterococcus sp. UD-01]|jgi:two-component system response regulator VicR|uniref:winged helix-turn-helix domain-containing protein n=1 Tax=Enterococcus sp. UD-01 TaxID=3373911 RepID=UPI00383550E4
MYNIGFISLNETHGTKSIDALKSELLHIETINKNDLSGNMHGYEAVIIDECEIQNIGALCELIILLKKDSDVFTWVISNRTHSMNHIVYLQLGADGIFEAEGNPEVCKLTILNNLNRYHRKNLLLETKADKFTENSVLKLRPCNFSVVLNGEEINLTKLEYKTIEFLQTKIGVAVSYEEIYKNVWNGEGGDKQYRVSNLIFHLRQKIEEDAAHPKYIKTIRSKGYKLTV